MQISSRFRQLIVFGAPLFAGIVLAMHPAAGFPPNPNIIVYDFIAPVADQFILVHVLFAPAIGLLGLALVTLLDRVHGAAAMISRVAVFFFVVFYIAYESIVGTATAALVRGARDLPPDQQAVISEAAGRMWAETVTGDFPAVIPVLGGFGWLIAVISAAVAVRRAGANLGASLLLGASFIMMIHPPPLGPLGMLLFLGSVVWLNRSGWLGRMEAPSPA